MISSAAALGRFEALAVGSPACQRSGEDAAGEQRAFDGIRGLASHKQPLGLRHERGGIDDVRVGRQMEQRGERLGLAQREDYEPSNRKTFLRRSSIALA